MVIHFIGGETEAQSSSVAGPRRTAGNWQSHDVNSGGISGGTQLRCSFAFCLIRTHGPRWTKPGQRQQPSAWGGHCDHCWSLCLVPILTSGHKARSNAVSGSWPRGSLALAVVWGWALCSERDAGAFGAAGCRGTEGAWDGTESTYPKSHYPGTWKPLVPLSSLFLPPCADTLYFALLFQQGSCVGALRWPSSGAPAFIFLFVQSLATHLSSKQNGACGEGFFSPVVGVPLLLRPFVLKSQWHHRDPHTESGISAAHKICASRGLWALTWNLFFVI